MECSGWQMDWSCRCMISCQARATAAANASSCSAWREAGSGGTDLTRTGTRRVDAGQPAWATATHGWLWLARWLLPKLQLVWLHDAWSETPGSLAPTVLGQILSEPGRRGHRRHDSTGPRLPKCCQGLPGTLGSPKPLAWPSSRFLTSHCDGMACSIFIRPPAPSYLGETVVVCTQTTCRIQYPFPALQHGGLFEGSSWPLCAPGALSPLCLNLSFSSPLLPSRPALCPGSCLVD